MKCCCAFVLTCCVFIAGCASSSGSVSQTTYKPAAGKAEASDPPIPVAPKDAQWTIYVMPIVSPDHVHIARRMRANLASTTKLKDWYVVHSEDKSDLYYGYYRSINDPNDRAESERAQRDRAILDGLEDSQHKRPFNRAIFVNIDVGDPTAPPEWDLTNAPGFYTLVVQQFKDHARRKDAAVQAVRDFRENGVQAYYYHSAAVSAVCIGTWPKESIRGDLKEVRPQNPGQGEDVFKGAMPQVVDPSLLAMMRKYPEMAVNYEMPFRTVIDPKTGQKVKKFQESYVTTIPRKTQAKEGILSAEAAPAEQLPPPPQPNRSTNGRLRSLQD